ncbi:MAG: hypothetical protein ACE5GA_09845 [Candidatus Zixiibacteriota bacterium]
MPLVSLATGEPGGAGKIDPALYERLLSATDTSEFSAILIIDEPEQGFPEKFLSYDSLNARERYQGVRSLLESRARQRQERLLGKLEALQ